jgi:hypothetical protein
MADWHVQGPNGVQDTRRHFLGWAIGVIGAFVSAAVGIPILAYALSSALRRESKPWADAGLSSHSGPVSLPRLST